MKIMPSAEGKRCQARDLGGDGRDGRPEYACSRLFSDPDRSGLEASFLPQQMPARRANTMSWAYVVAGTQRARQSTAHSNVMMKAMLIRPNLSL